MKDLKVGDKVWFKYYTQTVIGTIVIVTKRRYYIEFDVIGYSRPSKSWVRKRKVLGKV